MILLGAAIGVMGSTIHPLATGIASDFGKFTTRHKVILLLFFLAFVTMVYGIISWENFGLTIPTWW